MKKYGGYTLFITKYYWVNKAGKWLGVSKQKK